jgi:hypothetical protein
VFCSRITQHCSGKGLRSFDRHSLDRSSAFFSVLQVITGWLTEIRGLEQIQRKIKSVCGYQLKWSMFVTLKIPMFFVHPKHTKKKTE